MWCTQKVQVFIIFHIFNILLLCKIGCIYLYILWSPFHEIYCHENNTIGCNICQHHLIIWQLISKYYSTCNGEQILSWYFRKHFRQTIVLQLKLLVQLSYSAQKKTRPKVYGCCGWNNLYEEIKLCKKRM